MPLDNTTSSPTGQASPCAANTDLSDLLCVQMHPDASTFEPLDSNNIGLLNGGAALHWLHVKEKRPVSAGWSTAPKLTESGLRDSYREGQNIGVRLGLPSKTGDGYLHLIDLDVRNPAKSSEAWGKLLDIWPEARTFPTVISGSGGDSRHIYFLSSEAMPKRKLAKGDGWEIDLMGTGSQAVLPPSIHPKTGKPYVWERPFTAEARISQESLKRFVSARPLEVSPTDLSDLLREPADREEVRRALDCITDADDRDQWLNIGMGLHAEFDGSDEGYEFWVEWSRQSLKFNEHDQRRTWKSFKRGGIGIGTLFKIAMDYGYERGPFAQDSDFDDWNGDMLTLPDGTKPSSLTFLTPEECEASEIKPYVIKGLLREMHIGCIFGAPGAGKSLIAPFIGYMLAQGKDAFGMRTKAGGVFYVAAEDSNGMRGRVKALRKAHGGADLFKLVEGVSDLLVKGSPDFEALKQAVMLERPKLVFIDTLAMAFPGLEENSAEAMGRVVAVARALTQWNAAVILIHHDTKAEGGTPRGHSIFNGALDMSLHVKRDSEQKIIRGKLYKNRAGSPEREIAFTIATENFGFDEDGDPLTFPRCNALVGVPKKIKRLAPSRQAALDVLVQAGGRLFENEYKILLAESRAVSASDDAKSRRTIAGKAISDLIKLNRISFSDNSYEVCDGFGALPQKDAPSELNVKTTEILA